MADHGKESKWDKVKIGDKGGHAGKKQASKSAKAPAPAYTSPVQRLWARLLDEEKELMLERAKVKDVWLMILETRKKNEEERKSLKHDGFLDFLEPHTRITLNVGGQVFETTAEVLTRDRFSLLASLCRKDHTKLPLQPDKQGTFFIDRDWWIFRHILHFLRDGALPEDPPLLQELYAEALFYQLGSLKRAVEQRIQGTISYDDVGRRGQFLDVVLDTTASTLSGSGGRRTASPSRTATASSSSRWRREELSPARSAARGHLPDPFGFTH